MKPMSIETQRELVEALENLVGQCAQGGQFYPVVADSPSAKVAITEAAEALAKARAEMGGGDG